RTTPKVRTAVARRPADVISRRAFRPSTSPSSRTCPPTRSTPPRTTRPTSTTAPTRGRSFAGTHGCWPVKPPHIPDAPQRLLRRARETPVSKLGRHADRTPSAPLHPPARRGAHPPFHPAGALHHAADPRATPTRTGPPPHSGPWRAGAWCPGGGPGKPGALPRVHGRGQSCLPLERSREGGRHPACAGLAGPGFGLPWSGAGAATPPAPVGSRKLPAELQPAGEFQEEFRVLFAAHAARADARLHRAEQGPPPKAFAVDLQGLRQPLHPPTGGRGAGRLGDEVLHPVTDQPGQVE